ncbi:phosphoribosyltransferase-like protein [Tribonema minus]|uniref:ribose-phosphate diphosphokinase n=1 Tax=Tribonema minus TaxID=303371 RepID=A0A835YZZ4_9STRA|nr:phosphoribosyltransferase-like protein [Tribonema minus]
MAAAAAAAAAMAAAAATAACTGEEKPGGGNSVAPPDDVRPVHGTTTKKWHFWKGRDDKFGDLTDLAIFGGSAYPELAADICRLLGMEVELGTYADGECRVQILQTVELGTFADGECRVQILQTVLGKDVFIVSPTHTNTSLVELFLLVAAAKRSSAERITAVIPFYGYSRQDSRHFPKRETVAAADIALMLEAMGVDRVMSVDLHAGQIQGFFGPNTPMDHLMPTGVAAAYFSEIIQEMSDHGDHALALAGIDNRRVVVVAPQEGQVTRANTFKEKLSAYLGENSVWGEEIHKHLIGDVKGSLCILVDDLVDTGSTLSNAVKMLHAAGAGKITAYARKRAVTGAAAREAAAHHGRFSQGGDKIVEALDHLDFLVITNTLPHRDGSGAIVERKPGGKCRELTLAPLLAEAIYRIHKRIPFPELLYDEPNKAAPRAGDGARAPPPQPQGRIDPDADGGATADPFFEA